MELSELLAKAWEAVEKSGVPESLQETAFKEAVEYLRSGDPQASEQIEPIKRQGDQSSQRKPVSNVPDSSFFSQLSHETEVDETDLRDILELAPQGSVHVTRATKHLGASKSEQARTIVALVAGARAAGLGEDPIDGVAVRDEVKRKRAFDTNNYSAKVLGQLNGFNIGAKRNQIVTTSKWVAEFKAAVDQAHGRHDETSNS